MQAENDGSMVTAAGHGVTEGSPVMECVENCAAEDVIADRMVSCEYIML